MRESWDERDPLDALCRGDPGPFEGFVRTEYDTFLGFYVRLGAPRPEAEDLTQDLFLKLFEQAAGYQPQGRFAPFAFRVARNLWIDRGRRRALRRTVTPAGPGGTGEADERLATLADEGVEAPGEALARREEVRRLEAAMTELGEHHRMAFELGVVQELPYPEVASLLDVPVGTVKSRVFYAVRKLRELLDGAPRRATEGGARA